MTFGLRRYAANTGCLCSAATATSTPCRGFEGSGGEGKFLSKTVSDPFPPPVSEARWTRTIYRLAGLPAFSKVFLGIMTPAGEILGSATPLLRRFLTSIFGGEKRYLTPLHPPNIAELAVPFC